MKFLAWQEGKESAPCSSLSWSELQQRGRKRREHGRPSILQDAGEALMRWNVDLGADPTLLDRWNAVLDGRGLVVLAGQQPALLGGPLYSLYKLLTAIHLARHLEESLKLPCLAVFWLVGDDSDFGEVSSILLPARDGRLHKIRRVEVPPGGTLIGELPSADQQDLLRPGEPFLEAIAGIERLRGWIQEAVFKAKTWSALQAALFFRILPRQPFLVLDGGHDAVIQSGSDWLVRASGLPLDDLLRKGAGEAKAAGFEPALDPSLGQRSLYRIEGGRRSSIAGPADPAGRYGPNVVLRPLLQDALLPNVATVCGPSEIRYRAQLGPLYQAAFLPEPVRVPRLKARLLPQLKGVFCDEPGYRQMGLDPDRFVAELAEAARPAGLSEAAEAARRTMAGTLDRLRADLIAYDSSLGQVLDSAAGKIDYQAQRISESVSGKARNRLFKKEPLLAHLKEFVQPQGGEQERVLGFLAPYLLEEEAGDPTGPLGEATRSHLRRILEAGEHEMTALFLLEGIGVGEKEGRDG